MSKCHVTLRTFFFFFFFQAEDRIPDPFTLPEFRPFPLRSAGAGAGHVPRTLFPSSASNENTSTDVYGGTVGRPEERREGKGGRSRGRPNH